MVVLRNAIATCVMLAMAGCITVQDENVQGYVTEIDEDLDWERQSTKQNQDVVEVKQPTTPVTQIPDTQTQASSCGGGCGTGSCGGGCGSGSSCGGGTSAETTSKSQKVVEAESVAETYYKEKYDSVEGISFEAKDYGCHMQVEVYKQGALLYKWSYAGGRIYT